MKRVKTQSDDCPDEHGSGGLWEEHYIDSYRSGVSLGAGVGAAWAPANMIDPQTTISLGGTAIATPLNLCSPQVGLQIDQRVGRAIKVCKIHVRGSLYFIPGTTAAPEDGTDVRVQLVLDQQTNGAQMNPADLNNPGIGAVTTLKSFLNPNGFGRFVVLRDEFYDLNQKNLAVYGAGFNCSGVVKSFDMEVEIPEGIVVHFNALTTGTVTTIIDNSFHIVAAQSYPSVYGAYITYTSRVTFYNLQD